MLLFIILLEGEKSYWLRNPQSKEKFVKTTNYCGSATGTRKFRISERQTWERMKSIDSAAVSNVHLTDEKSSGVIRPSSSPLDVEFWTDCYLRWVPPANVQVFIVCWYFCASFYSRLLFSNIINLWNLFSLKTNM